MKIKVLVLLCAAFALGAAGCRTTPTPADVVRLASDVPAHFLVGGLDGQETFEPEPGPCRNPMVDPRDQTRLTLVRSSTERGDYEVAAGRYGTREGELLRIDCATGRAVGVVRR
jgi:hypothetical protein